MNTPQLFAFGIILFMMVAFVWGRWRYDLVAVGALLASISTGIVAPDEAFSGLSDDIVVIVGSALVVSAAVARSGVMEVALRRLAPNLRTSRAQLVILVLTVTLLSAFIKNIGALAIMMPIAFQMARKSGVSPSLFLMPMSFGSLQGGLMTQIGTSPNVIVSRVREELTGSPFTMFDFTPVGAALALVGVVFLALCYRLLPERAQEKSSLDQAIAIKNYTTEVRIPADSPSVGETVGAVQRLGGGQAMITGIIAANGKRRLPLPDSVVQAGELLIVEGEPEALDRIVSQGKLAFSERRDQAVSAMEVGVVEAVVGDNSSLVGRSAQELALFDAAGINLLAVSRREKRFTERLGEIRFQVGDIVVIQGDLEHLPERLRQWDCLPLVERNLTIGSIRNGLIPVLILILAMGSTALGLISVPIAFFTAAVLMVATRTVPLRDVYSHIDAPILIMLAALIPVSDSLRTTGATDLIANWLSATASSLPAYGALALILVVAMAVTPFLNNAATVLVMAPIAATFAADLGHRPEAFLMAVAIGAGSDFLTPIGHQCNTLVMGPGGYRFGDYWRLGLPLSILVVLVAVPMLLLVWAL